MLNILSTTRTRLRKPTYPVNAVFPLSWLASAITIKAAGSSVELTAPPHYPRVPEATQAITPKQDSVNNGISYDMPKEVVEPIVESWHAFFRAWSFNAPWWGGSVAQLALMVEVVKPKRLKETANLLFYPALKFAIEEYIAANYHHIYVNGKRLTLYSDPEGWTVNHCKNSPYISISMLRQGGHIRHVLNFIPLDREHFLCFGFVLDRQSRATGEQEVEKQIPAEPMIKLINQVMSSVQINRKDAESTGNGFSGKSFAEEAKNQIATINSESLPLTPS